MITQRKRKKEIQPENDTSKMPEQRLNAQGENKEEQKPQQQQQRKTNQEQRRTIKIRKPKNSMKTEISLKSKEYIQKDIRNFIGNNTQHAKQDFNSATACPKAKKLPTSKTKSQGPTFKPLTIKGMLKAFIKYKDSPERDETLSHEPIETKPSNFSDIKENLSHLILANKGIEREIKQRVIEQNIETGDHIESVINCKQSRQHSPEEVEESPSSRSTRELERRSNYPTKDLD